MNKGMTRKVFNTVYKDREIIINQPSYNDILLLEAQKTTERKFKLNQSRTVTIKIKRNK